MNVIKADELIFDGTPALVQALVQEWPRLNHGDRTTLRTLIEPTIPPDAPKYSTELWSVDNGGGLWLDAISTRSSQSKIVILANVDRWPAHKPSWGALRAYIDEHMATDELAHIKDPTIRAAVRAYIDRQPGETRATIADHFGCDPGTITRNLPARYKDERKARPNARKRTQTGAHKKPGSVL